jgi:hypothetical protein
MRTLNKYLVGLALCALAAVRLRAQTANTRTALYAEINSSLASGQSGGITAAQLRGVFNDVVASAFNQLSDTSLTIGTPGFSDTGVAQQWTGSVSGYYQFLLQNTSSAATASADYIVNNNLGTATTYYGDFGINSSTFSGSGSFSLANATYLYGANGDLVLGTLTSGAGAGNTIHFVIANGSSDTATITSSGLNIGSSNRGSNATTFAGGSSVADNGSGQVTVAAAGTNQNVAINPSGTGHIVNGSTPLAPYQDVAVGIFQALGSSIKAEVMGFNLAQCPSNNVSPSSGSVYFEAIYIPYAQTITGVEWYQGTNGNYTANNYNGWGLYSFSGGTATLVASTTNNGSIFQSGTGVMTAAFSSTYAASAGVYYVAPLYSESAVTQAPLFVGNNSLGGNGSTGVSTGPYLGRLAGQTALPSPQTMSSTIASGSFVWAALY